MTTKPQKSAQALQKAMQHHQANRLHEAIALYRNILTIDSRNADACHLLGLALHQLGKDDEAIPLLNRAIMLNPAATYYANFAELWRRQGRWAEAIDCYQNVLRFRPDDHPIRYLLAEALAKTDKHEESESHLRMLISAGKADADTWSCLCEVLRRQDRLDEGIEAAKRAVSLNPNSAVAWHSLGWTMMRRGYVREALPHINQAIRLRPDWALVAWRRAWAHLLLGDFVNGWRDYEARWHDPELQLGKRRQFPGNPWRGEDLTGKAIFVHLEQGLGDYIQFIRYVPMIQSRGAVRVLAECPEELDELIARSLPGVERILRTDQVVRYDYHVPIMSLPFAFGTTLQTVPSQVPYLKPDPAKVEAWRARLAQHPGMKVGLVWAGSPSHSNDRARSIPLKQLAPLAQVPGVRFVSLQKGAASKQAADVPEQNLLDWTEDLKTFDDTVALISALDLTITVDTSVAHLAGALAKPVWTLITLSPDFRWMLEREDSPWYPTMRLFRQPALGDWPTVVQRVAQELSRMAGKT